LKINGNKTEDFLELHSKTVRRIPDDWLVNDFSWVKWGRQSPRLYARGRPTTGFSHMELCNGSQSTSDKSI